MMYNAVANALNNNEQPNPPALDVHPPVLDAHPPAHPLALDVHPLVAPLPNNQNQEPVLNMAFHYTSVTTTVNSVLSQSLAKAKIIYTTYTYTSARRNYAANA
jgi:hypothetical protein